MELDNYVGNFKEFFYNRQAAALDTVPSKESGKFTELVAEQERLTRAIVAKTIPGEDSTALLCDLEAVITLIGELSHQHIYQQGLRDGAGMVRLLELNSLINKETDIIRAVI